MKILWANPNMLHPTTKGGQIRTLEMLRILSKRHDIHYVAFESDHSEARERSGEYCSELLTVPFRVVPRRSARFARRSWPHSTELMPVQVEVAQTVSAMRIRSLKLGAPWLCRGEWADASPIDHVTWGPDATLSRCRWG